MRISDWSSDVCSSDLSAPMAADDFRLSHKTSLRDVYDIARHESGAAEVVFVDEPGFVTEGSWSNIFVERDDQLLTPPLALGLLPGVLRAELLDKGRPRSEDSSVGKEGPYMSSSVGAAYIK